MAILVRVHASERGLEGAYWLALLKGKAFEATEDTLHATEAIEAGFLVVKAQWFKLESKRVEGDLRSYSLLDAEVLLVVNTMVRLGGLRFDDGKGGPSGRVTKSMAKVAEGRGKLYYFGKESHISIEACCDDDE